MASPDKATSRSDGEQKSAAPSISLPKGGGAIRGMGEKFAANPVTGTGSMSVPLATSPGRSGFGPQLSLSYDSGAGNGPFGFGWSLSLPSITRKTDKGLPQYLDADESDVFILSGSEDLVPVLQPDGKRFKDDTTAPGYVIHRYRPRIEGLFARIERWTRDADGDVHWRSISKDNILTLYGKDSNSRIFDPVDALRVFTWLICETRDDKGNAVLYEYKPEDGVGVDLIRAHERNRGDRNSPLRKANRYLKHVCYGNRVPLLDNAGHRPRFLTDLPATQVQNVGWMFEVVFDYEDHDPAIPKPRDDEEKDAAGMLKRPWSCRQDPFSTYRAGFEVRTYRLCRRVLMFHHFPGEAGVGSDCLVRSTEFSYAESPIASFITSVTQSGYVRQPDGTYLKKSLPPLEFEYSQVPTPDQLAQQPIRELDAESLANLPVGLDGASYQWMDLDGEGTSGILTEQADGWYYKRNLSANHQVREDGHERTIARFGPTEVVASKPAVGLASGAQFLDLAGDGQTDLVQMEGSVRGFYERTDDASWAPFQPFASWPDLNTRDPDLKFVDLTGDGHADILITEGEALTWYPSLAEDGFGRAARVNLPLDEEKGPRLVFADGTQSIYLADLSGDGLSDLVRIRNGEVCYWPNLGYGRFGAKVTMDNAPWFDSPDQFDQRRIRLADTDGSGTTDILYLRRDAVQIYFNQSGNRWSDAVPLPQFPPSDNISSVQALDLLGNGTACLVWSSPLPGTARRPMRYLALMEEKPHLLVGVKNNLGAETKVRYAPSTKFYLDDKRDGKPWITKLPFPVHVVERVATYDRISRNHFVTRYAYHHGYFDGVEREFRGFGLVEQFDTEEFAVLTASGTLPDATNLDAASHVPPVLTKTWFHTGVYVGREHVSDFFAGLLDADDKGEYYREPGLTDAQACKLLLDDTVLPDGLSVDEEREACRALKGSMLRQEVYALDGTAKAKHPYTVAEQNFTIEGLQPKGGNRHAVFFTHAREAITYHYERNPADPRIQHALTLEVDEFGNALKSTAIGYGRRKSDTNLSDEDQKKQTQTLITYTENRVTNPIDDVAVDPDAYRTPLPAETRIYELTGLNPENGAQRFSFDELTRNNFDKILNLTEVLYQQSVDYSAKRKRLIEHVRTLYRENNLNGLLPLTKLKSLALPGESYKLASISELAKQIYVDSGKLSQADLDSVLANDGKYVHSEGDSDWWIPSGRVFYSPNGNDTAQQELAYAHEHFFLPHRYRDPFHTDQINTETVVTFDSYKLLMTETRDALDNTVRAQNDYRVLTPRLMTDPNGNRSEVALDALGLVVATAVKGKDGQNLGDLLKDFDPDPPLAALQAFVADPRVQAASLLGKATTRIVYDLDRYQRSGQPPFAATLARETHFFDPGGAQTTIQISFSYSDGFGREIQKKIQAERGDAPQRGPSVMLPSGDVQPGALVRDANGKLVQGDTPQRWVGNGRTVFNNKGKPVRQYEPFFSATHLYEEERDMTDTGVSPILFYDPVDRVVATLHPNYTYEKVAFNPWQQTTYDVNDTVLVADPKTDADVGGFFSRLPDADYLPTWYTRRQGGALGDQEQDAAEKAAKHANTPTVAHADSLGRTFLTIADNGPSGKYETRVELDIEGNQREVIDAKDRVVMHYDYHMAGPEKDGKAKNSNLVHQSSMEAGERWMLNDVAGKPIRAWDSRGHTFRTAYDPLRRPTDSYLCESAGAEMVVGQSIYGESRPNPEADNLRGKVVELRDQAGVVTSDLYDFKGNLLRSQRRLADTVDSHDTQIPAYKTTVDWSGGVQLESDIYITRTTYDALNRPVTLRTSDNSVIRHTYNEANLLERVDVMLRGATANGQPVWTPFVTNIDYNAKGQRMLIDYGNGVRTTYEYDPLTFRLVHLLTRRDAVAFPDDCPQPAPAGWPGCQVQNLSYTYDPAGNITHIRDDAQQTIYFKNKRVEPSAEYTYDAIYRLIEATGREHLGQADAPIPHSYNDAGRVGVLSADAAGRFSPNDSSAMGTYLERYVYDEVGNFLEMQHSGTDQANSGWTRTYAYNETSLIEDGTGETLLKISNRLSSTTIGATTETYSTGGNGYDAHGNMLKMPQLRVMQWDFKDQLQMTQRQTVNGDDDDTDGMQHQGERTWYVYDAAGQRVRKVTERQASEGQTPTRMKERIYLGGFEIYREYNGNGATVTLERETLHIMDDKQRIALVETRTQGDEPDVPAQLIRYQFSNHLGSASLELDNQAQIISYEEYTPYGSTSYQAGRSAAEVSLKRYRYTGKERDEESGLYYHGARYYAPWLGRWTACDPLTVKQVISSNYFSYVSNRPLVLIDPDGRDECPPNSLCPAPRYEVLTHNEFLGREFWLVHDNQAGKDIFFAWTPGEQPTVETAPWLSSVRTPFAAVATAATKDPNAGEFVANFEASLGSVAGTLSARGANKALSTQNPDPVSPEKVEASKPTREEVEAELKRTAQAISQRVWSAAEEAGACPQYEGVSVGYEVHPANNPESDKIVIGSAVAIRRGWNSEVYKKQEVRSSLPDNAYLLHIPGRKRPHQEEPVGRWQYERSKGKTPAALGSAPQQHCPTCYGEMKARGIKAGNKLSQHSKHPAAEWGTKPVQVVGRVQGKTIFLPPLK